MATIRQRITQLERRHPPPTDYTPILALQQLTDHELDQLEAHLTRSSQEQAEAIIQAGIERHRARAA